MKYRVMQVIAVAPLEALRAYGGKADPICVSSTRFKWWAYWSALCMNRSMRGLAFYYVEEDA